MYTVIVFWQNDSLNEEAEWVLENDEKNIFVITLRQDGEQRPDIEQLVSDIAYAVNAKEQWRMFLIDNYEYQCNFRPKDDNAVECGCCGESCVSRTCGKGRNPFTACKQLTNASYKNHREWLIQIIQTILDMKGPEFVPPGNMFVIAVRDGDFFCKRTQDSININSEFWKVAEEFPAQCRYLVYDVHWLKKNLYQREIFWLYCLIALLAGSDLTMDELQSGSMYRIDVKYALQEYHQYLQECREHILQENERLQEKDMSYKQYRDRGEEAIYFSTDILRSNLHRLERVNTRDLRSRRWNNKKQEIKRQISRACGAVPEDYKVKWNKLRKDVSEEEGDYGKVYAEEKEKYERQILNIGFHRDAVSVKAEAKYTSLEDEIGQFDLYCKEFEECWEFQLNVRSFWGFFGAFFLMFGGSYCLLFYKQLAFKDFMIRFGMIGAAAIVALIFYYICDVRIKTWLKCLKINSCINRVEKYQEVLNEDRIHFLKSTRNTMLYWKREQNLQKYNKIWNDRHLQMDDITKQNGKLIKKLDMLLGMEEVEQQGNSGVKGKKQKRTKDVMVGSRKMTTEFIFINSVKFKMREHTGRRDTDR